MALLGMVGGVAFMCMNLWWLLFPKTASEQVIMAPVLPFVNVPGHELIHYFLALIFAGGLHEFGHAMAALSHNCGMEG
jgi:hypothetical protein